MKYCNKCKIYKEKDEFYKRKGGYLRSYCKTCEYVKKTEILLINFKRCQTCKLVKEFTQFYKSDKGKYNVGNRCKICEKKRYCEYNRIHRKELTRKEILKYKKDPQFRAIKNTRMRVKQFLLGKNKYCKSLKCSFKNFIFYLESQFQPGMTWENYGEWQIDHIKPLGLAYQEGQESFSEACKYTNLQPLWLKDHFIKTTKDVEMIKLRKSQKSAVALDKNALQVGYINGN